MLLVNQIREDYAAVLAGLQKRNFHNAPSILDQVIALDDLRKSTQSQRDQIQAEANTISKQIGVLMKEGRAEEAVAIRERTSQIKEQIKDLESQNTQAEEDLKALLYTIPNVPHSSVPKGRSAEDNEVVLENGAIPELFEGKLPHWELIKKYDIIDFDLVLKSQERVFQFTKEKEPDFSVP